MASVKFDQMAPLSAELPIAFGVAAGEVPVRLVVAGLNLLETGLDELGGRGMPINLVEFAVAGLSCLRHTKRTGRGAFPLDESGYALLLSMANGHVLVHSTCVDKTVRVSYTELLRAWTEFAVAVREALTARFSHLRDLDEWALIESDHDLSDRYDWDAMWDAEFSGREHAFARVDASEE